MISRVTEFRKTRGFSQKELAARMHLDNSQISRIERGINVCGVDTALKLSQVLDATVSQLFQLEDADLAEQQELF